MKRLSSVLLVFLIFCSGCIYLPDSSGVVGIGQAPAISRFDVSPEMINSGQRAKLSWTVTGATSVTIDNGVGSVALSGTRTIIPAATTAYTMTATNQYGNTTASVQVHVSDSGTGTTPASGVPVINSFTASPDAVPAGGYSTLSWDVSNATSVSISPTIGNVDPASGSGIVTLGSATTQFILTATNAAGSATSSVTVTIADGSGLPLINSFTASPAVISPGASSTLSWNVSGAAQITLTGFGAVDSSGSNAVSPASTTNYTLTATSSGGSWVSQTVTVMVTSGGTLPMALPDLIIQSITKVETSAGYVIGFKVKNNGPVSAGASICRLFAEGSQKSNANVPALAAGATYDGTFPDWTYTPLMPHLKVVAEASGIIVESDETNNEKSVTMAVPIIYDFVAQAPGPVADVSWKSGAGSLTFGGALDDSKGFACYRTNVTLEDNHVYSKVLETHPQWVDNGYITGTYLELYNDYAFTVKPGEHFYARCGFIKNATSGKVRYKVMIRPEGGPNTWIFEGIKSYNGTVKTIDVDLTPYAGKKADFILRVEAEGVSTQDWAAWAEAKIIR